NVLEFSCPKISSEDMYAQDSIQLLTSSGIQFKKHEEDGIDAEYFAELLMTSGIVLSEEVKWITFHSLFLFLLVIPLNQTIVLLQQKNYFEDNIDDDKYLGHLYGLGSSYNYFEDNIDDDKYLGHLYGLGSSYVQNGNAFGDENNLSS
ncbi:CCR4-NOT transcription complex subunit 7-like, partial [Anneissia japonica]|uniref:CCR4-NOT transcription complex subunit 7-like n=1 Tax=Anneissia japonica TaxID=1529436 RepID=UPI0014259801